MSRLSFGSREVSENTLNRAILAELCCSLSLVSGTTVYYKPGFIVGGKVDHDCGKERGVGYFLELLVCLAPFGKEPLRATLSGITNHSDNYDMTVRTL
jgi:RNA 3'-terminal phosphate cyclase